MNDGLGGEYEAWFEVPNGVGAVETFPRHLGGDVDGLRVSWWWIVGLITITTWGSPEFAFADEYPDGILAWSQDVDPAEWQVDIDVVVADPGSKSWISVFPNESDDAQLDPVWSPDGNYMAYTVHPNHGEWPQLRIQDFESGESWIVYEAPEWRQIEGVEWSPDGTMLAFNSFDHDDNALYTVGVDGTGLQSIATDLWYPKWAPDGERIVAGYSEDTLWVTKADGSDRREFFSAADWPAVRTLVYPGDWSPDGTEFLVHIQSSYLENLFDPEDQLAVLDGETGELKRWILDDSWSPKCPQWSPDGAHIAFLGTSREHGEGIYGMHPKEGSNHPVLWFETYSTSCGGWNWQSCTKSTVTCTVPTDLGSALFDDVPPDHTFASDIAWLASAGITKGCNPPENTRFCPTDFVTRGQMAAFLVRAMGYTDDGGGDLFVDDDGSTFENDIDKLGTAGVTKGCNPPTNDLYCPTNFVTRAQMAAFLVRALGYTDNGGGDLFIDDDGSVFENDIDKLATAGVTRGCNPPLNDEFCPTDFVTRGQMAAFLHRALGG